MRNRLLGGIFCVIAVFSTAFIPKLILCLIPEVESVQAHSTMYRDSVNCTGEIAARTCREIYTETEVLPSRVLVEVGDTVQKGQVLAVIDTELTYRIISRGIVMGTDTNLLAKQEYPYNLGGEEIWSVMGSAAESTENNSLLIPHEILAPIDGVVTSSSLSEGVLAATASPAFVISENDGYLLKAVVEEKDIGRIQIGNQAVITGTAFDGVCYGTVSRIYPSARKVLAGTSYQTVVDVDILIEQSTAAKLRPGYSAKATIYTGDACPILSLTYDVIYQDENNQEYVYIAEHGRARRRDIETGEEFLYYTQVTKGLTESDIILTGAEDLHEGSLIRLKGNRGRG